VEALCFALGYTQGRIVTEFLINVCPEVYAVTANGLAWFSNTTRAGMSALAYECQGTRVIDDPPTALPPIEVPRID
jgi:hypothetical protein